MNLKIFIENPVNQTLVSVNDWMEVKNPHSAQFVIIKTSENSGIKIHKNQLAGRYDFKEAQEVTAVLDFDDTNFRCPTRRECLDIYDARFQGLDEALEVIGGDKIDDHYIWTCESDTDPEHSSYYAFFFNGDYGELDINGKYHSYSVRPVTALKFDK